MNDDALEANGEVVRSVYKAMRRGDLPAVLAAMDATIEWREAEGNPYQPSGSAWVGPDAVQQNLFSKIGGDWDRFIVDPQRYHEAGDVVVVEGRYVAFHKSGRNLDCQFCHVWRVGGDGKVQSFQQYIDTAKFQEAMGAR
jgi:ketosteroid isomerase-like protein